MSQRVVTTPGTLQGKRRAVKRHRCDGHLTDVRHYIEPGHEYVASALPPYTDGINGAHWWHARFCADCWPVEFVDTSDVPEWVTDCTHDPVCGLESECRDLQREEAAADRAEEKRDDR